MSFLTKKKGKKQIPVIYICNLFSEEEEVTVVAWRLNKMVPYPEI